MLPQPRPSSAELSPAANRQGRAEGRASWHVFKVQQSGADLLKASFECFDGMENELFCLNSLLKFL